MATFTRGRIDPIDTYSQLINLFLLGLVPTAISNVTLIISLKQISSTMAAVLGVFEPMTAMCVGILLFGEPLTLPIVVGFMLIMLQYSYWCSANVKRVKDIKKIKS